MCDAPVPARVVATGPPRWLLVAKGLLAGLLVLGALLPQVGGFDGKGMAYRLPIFLAPALVVPVRWLRNRDTYPVALDAALTLPFLLDTAANGAGLYDRFTRTDDVLHFANWLLLIGGVTAALAVNVVETKTPRWLVGTAGAGIGAATTIGWEVAEYGVMRAGVGGLSLTYADTLTDLVLSTAGGAVGAFAAVRWVMPRR
ncbi:hypothetical protein BH20ACT4_BH20ACT4_04350 [soil metagenome]